MAWFGRFSTTTPVSYPSSRLTLSPDLPEPSGERYSQSIILAIAGGLTFFGFWASVTPVYEVTSGRGMIQPNELVTRVEHLEGGMVSALYVKEGDVVFAGQPVVALDTQAVEAELEKVRSRRDALAANESRLAALLAADFATAGLSETEIIFAGADTSFAEDARYRLAQVEAIRAEQDVARARQDAHMAQYEMLSQELSILRAQLSRYDRLRGGDIIPSQQIEDLDRNAIRLETEMTGLAGETDVLEATVVQLAAREREVVAQFRREAAIALEDVRAELRALRQSLTQLEDRLDRAVLRSPIAGVVNDLTIDSVGEVMAAGEMAAEIIPIGGGVFAEVEIPADRIGGVMIGSEASIKVLTYDFTKFGELRALVEHISPSSFLTPEGEAVFRVRLSFNPDGLSAAGQGVAVTPGMTVVADIVSEKRSIWAYILKPIEIVADRAMTEA